VLGRNIVIAPRDIRHLNKVGAFCKVSASAIVHGGSMAVKYWEQERVIYCERAQQLAALEVEVVYPADSLPEWTQRVVAHRCSLSTDCELRGVGNCYWTGSNPLNDPFEVIK